MLLPLSQGTHKEINLSTKLFAIILTFLTLQKKNQPVNQAGKVSPNSTLLKCPKYRTVKLAYTTC